MLSREFYLRGANTVAPELLGKLLVHETDAGKTAGMIVEVESYIGTVDKASHAYPSLNTPRTRVQFGPGGYAYVYLIYGMYSCFNIVVNLEGIPEAILVRALEPVDGIPLMKRRRKRDDVRRLCDGPGRLCMAMDISREQYAADLCQNVLYLEEYRAVPPAEIMVSPRINIDYAEEYREYLWRYFIRGNPYVSNVAKKYKDAERAYSSGLEDGRNVGEGAQGQLRGKR